MWFGDVEGIGTGDTGHKSTSRTGWNYGREEAGGHDLFMNVAMVSYREIVQIIVSKTVVSDEIGEDDSRKM